MQTRFYFYIGMCVTAGLCAAQAQNWPGPRGGARCGSAIDCGFGGDCIDHVCECWPTFAGPNCTALNLLPAPKLNSAGGAGYALLYRQNWSSWGGSVVEDFDGSYHVIYSNMANKCGLNSWYHNSESRQMPSKGSAAGPYGPNGGQGNATGTLVQPLFSHNTQARVNPGAKSGDSDAFLVFHIGHANGPDHPPVCHCSDGSTGSSDCGAGSHPIAYNARAPTHLRANKRVLSPGDNMGPAVVASAPHPAGPWTALQGSHSSWAFNNPAPLIFPNGTTLMIYKGMVDGVRTMEIARAPQWNASFEFVRSTGIMGEDPFVWEQNGTFHMIFHTCCSDKIMSTAWSEDALSWYATPGSGHNVNPYPAFQKEIELEGGGTVELARRERHYVIIDRSTGTPTHLVNGVQPASSSAGGSPGAGSDRIGSDHTVRHDDPQGRQGTDWTYTSLQPLATT